MLLVLALLAGARDEDDARGAGGGSLEAVVDGGVVLVELAVSAEHGARLAGRLGSCRLDGCDHFGCLHALDGRGIDGKRRKALLGRHGIDCHLGRAARGELAVDGVLVRIAERADGGACGQWQYTVVLKQDGAFLLHLKGDGVGALLGLLGAGVLLLVVGRVPSRPVGGVRDTGGATAHIAVEQAVGDASSGVDDNDEQQEEEDSDAMQHPVLLVAHLELVFLCHLASSLKRTRNPYLHHRTQSNRVQILPESVRDVSELGWRIISGKVRHQEGSRGCTVS